MTRTSHFTALALAFVAINARQFAEAGATTSDDLYNRYFANVLDGQPCYARTYDDKHLDLHRDQRVKSIEIELSKANSDGQPNETDRFELGFALKLKSSLDWYGQTASCKTGETGFECFLQGDGGVFRLTPIADGGLRLATGESGIALEGSDAIELPGNAQSDRVFDLQPSKEECESAAAYFEHGNE